MCVLGLSEPIDSVLTFPNGYDTLEYSWVKATAVSVRLRILFVTLQNTNSELHYTDRHDLTECRLVKDLAAERQRGRDDHRRDDRDDREQAGPGGTSLGFQEQQHAVATIFARASAPLSRRRAKLL